VILGGVLAGGLLLASACGGTDTKPVAPVAKSGPQKHDEAIEHEACNTAGNRVEALDANGDHKPDITRVYDKKTNKELCRISDLNHDGKPDLYEYYDASGNIRRREADYDDNGTVDAIEGLLRPRDRKAHQARAGHEQRRHHRPGLDVGR